MKPIVVEGVQFEIYEAGLLNASGTVMVSPSCVPFDKVIVKGNKLYAGQLLVDISGFTSSVVTGWIPSSGSSVSSGSINTTVQKVSTLQGKPFLEENESSTITITGQVQSGITVVPGTTTVIVKIKSEGAGQNVVNAT